MENISVNNFCIPSFYLYIITISYNKSNIFTWFFYMFYKKTLYDPPFLLKSIRTYRRGLGGTFYAVVESGFEPTTPWGEKRLFPLVSKMSVLWERWYTRGFPKMVLWTAGIPMAAKNCSLIRGQKKKECGQELWKSNIGRRYIPEVFGKPAQRSPGRLETRFFLALEADNLGVP